MRRKYLINRIKLILPETYNIKMDIDKNNNDCWATFKVKGYRGLLFGFSIGYNEHQLWCQYKEIIDKFRPSDAYLTCNIYDKNSIIQFKKDVLYCKKHFIKTFEESMICEGWDVWEGCNTYELFNKMMRNSRSLKWKR